MLDHLRRLMTAVRPSPDEEPRSGGDRRRHQRVSLAEGLAAIELDGYIRGPLLDLSAGGFAVELPPASVEIRKGAYRRTPMVLSILGHVIDTRVELVNQVDGRAGFAFRHKTPDAAQTIDEVLARLREGQRLEIDRVIVSPGGREFIFSDPTGVDLKVRVSDEDQTVTAVDLSFVFGGQVQALKYRSGRLLGEPQVGLLRSALLILLGIRNPDVAKALRPVIAECRTALP